MQVYWHKYLHLNETCMKVTCVNVKLAGTSTDTQTFTHATCIQVSFKCKHLSQYTCMCEPDIMVACSTVVVSAENTT
jgi:hypothetical protein